MAMDLFAFTNYVHAAHGKQMGFKYLIIIGLVHSPPYSEQRIVSLRSA